MKSIIYTNLAEILPHSVSVLRILAGLQPEFGGGGVESSECIRQAPLSLFFSDLSIKIAGYCAISGSKFKKNQKSKIQSIVDHYPCSVQLFNVMEFFLVFVIFPDVLSSITPCGISFPFLFFITIETALPLLKIFMQAVGYL